LALAVLSTLAASLVACSTSGKQDDAKATTTSTAKGATSTTGGSSTTAPEAGSLDWKPCDDAECAKLEVPVDYSKPDGKTLELALLRRPAAKPAERIGAILVNPGGPGGSGVELASYLPFPDEITDRFDIVGFDPRGVGDSTPLDCHSHLQEIYDADPTMEDAADRAHYIQVSQAFVDECKQKYADLLPHLGTVDVARDMDQIRAAMGDEKLNYLGYSYGTSIGEQYARLFPTRVRAMVIDGVVDPSETGLQAAAGQAEGFTSALNAFIASCDTDGCGLDAPASQVIDQVIAASEKAPIPAPGADRPATPGVVALGMGQAMYQEALWPSLGRALSEARDGDGTGLVNLADDYLGRGPDGSYDGGFEIYFAVSCIDSQWPKDPDAILAEGKKVGQQFPRVGEALVNDYLRCALWPTPPQPLKPVPTDLKGLPPIVVISTTHDPATPYQSGVDVAEQIPDARLLTNVGEGHTIYANGKSCIDDTVNAYFLDLTAPEDGKRCE
jgi:pimeloyl-ACP methyl ester carboxylesterase